MANVFLQNFFSANTPIFQAKLLPPVLNKKKAQKKKKWG